MSMGVPGCSGFGMLRSMSAPPSPCVRNCTLNDQDICLGCGRTLEDITSWTKMSDDDKAACVARGRDNLVRLNRAVPDGLPLIGPSRYPRR